MPAAMTEKQKAFAVEYASNGGNATAAAKVAGYSEKSAHEIGRQQLQKPLVRELIAKELTNLQTRSGAVGLNALIEICKSTETPANARVAAARALCEHAGLVESAKTSRDVGSLGLKAENLVNAREVLEAFAATNYYDAKAALQ